MSISWRQVRSEVAQGSELNGGMEAAKMDPLNVTYMFDFERNHDEERIVVYFDKRWTDSFLYSGIYVFLVLGGKFYMRDRPRFELRLLLTMWNFVLAVFSILGTIRMLSYLVAVLKDSGWHFAVCDSSSRGSAKVTAFWTMLFVLSKVLELGDTAFIVLRKQNLIFLHWYHHVTVLLFSWFSYQQGVGSSRFVCTMNYAVHSFMYSYYLLRAMRFKIPVQMNMIITTLQILQMAVGLAVCVSVYTYVSRGIPCHGSYAPAVFGIAIYFSYVVLFIHFFYTTYVLPKQAVRQKQN